MVDQAYVDGLNSGKDAWTLCGADEVNWRTGMMTLKDKPLENVQAASMMRERRLGFQGRHHRGIADFFKIPVDNLKATIARVNEFARTGKDLDFNYRSRFVDLSTGPYWIYRAFRACTTRWAA